jgi:hypothetical protein
MKHTLYLYTGCLILFVSAFITFPPISLAQTDEIQVYDAAINSPGQFNLVWHNNYTPNGRPQPDFPGGIVPNHALNGVPEWAYGVTDWLELGTYLPLYSLTDDGRFLLNGVKLRALLVVPHAHDLAFFYGINFELSYNAPHWESTHFSGEIRPIVGGRVGAVDIIFNPIIDTSFKGIDELDFAPAVRVAYNFSQTWAGSLEHYSDFGPIRHFDAPADQQQTLFAVVDYYGNPNSIEFGVGHGFTAASDKAILKLMVTHNF